MGLTKARERLHNFGGGTVPLLFLYRRAPDHRHGVYDPDRGRNFPLPGRANQRPGAGSLINRVGTNSVLERTKSIPAVRHISDGTLYSTAGYFGRRRDTWATPALAASRNPAGTNTVAHLPLELGYNSDASGTYNLNGGPGPARPGPRRRLRGLQLRRRTLKANAAFTTGLLMTFIGTGGNANFNTTAMP